MPTSTWGIAHYDDLGELPDAVGLASLGCGNPTAVADLRAGETVLDLGSGGGIDVLTSAKRVRPTGFAYGLDMTQEMLDLARRGAADALRRTSASGRPRRARATPVLRLFTRSTTCD